MDGLALADKISRGMGAAARRIGSPYIVYRPVAAATPINSRNRIIRLFAAFNAGDGRFVRGEPYGDAVWWGVFDASYTRPGDFLVGAGGTFFIASQAALLPVQCIKTNRTLTIVRPAPVQIGGYSGLVKETATVVEVGWPASILALSARISGNLPEARYGNWLVLLPQLPAAPMAGDALIDDLGRNFVLASAEHSDLGWRLMVREVAG
jgi:hypothetical protein